MYSSLRLAYFFMKLGPAFVYYQKRRFYRVNWFNTNKARNPGTIEKWIANSDGQTDGLTDLPTDRVRVQYLSEYVLRCKKGTIRKNAVAQWRRVGLNFR